MVVAALAQLDRALKRGLPLGLTFVIVLLSVVPLPVPEYAVLAPSFALMAVYYWTVHRPDLMRPWSVFVIGVLDDVLSGTPQLPGGHSVAIHQAKVDDRPLRIPDGIGDIK